ncbi:hypothetical protein ACSBR1_019593 [Camellia fascicularis]
MNLPQLHQFKAAMMEIRTKIGICADRIVHEQPANPFRYGSSFGGGSGGLSFQVGPNFAGGGVGSPCQVGPSFAGGGGISALPVGAGSGSFGVGGGGSDNNGIVPFDGRVPATGGSKAPYGFNHGYGRGFY